MPTRTIFYHIPVAGQVIFYLLAIAAMGICLHGVYRRVHLWRQGRPITPPIKPSARLRALAIQVLGQRRVRRRAYGGTMHVLIFFAFLVLFAGTCIVAVEHY